MRRVSKTGNFPRKFVNDAFRGEAERIWEALEQGNKTDVWGGFKLPKYKELDEYKNIPADTLKAIKEMEEPKPEKIRDVSYINNTYEVLKSTLFSELIIKLP